MNDFATLKTAIKETEEWLTRELTGVRTGRATPALLDSIKVQAYGSRTPLREVAGITTEDARTLRIIPWDKELSKPIEAAITEADLGVGVGADDQGVRVTFPELTAERRTQLVKIAGERTEQARVTLRGHRTDAIKEVEAAQKEGGMGEDDVKRLKGEIQKLIDAANDALSAHLAKKEQEIAH